MHFVHLKNPYRQNILSIILSLLCVPFSFGSICKYWIFNIEDTSSLNRSSKYVNARYRKLKTKTKIKTKKIQSTILGTFIKKNSPQNLTVLHCGLIELEILEIFATGYLSKAIIWTWIIFQVLQSATLLKKGKKSPQKDASHQKIAWISKRQKKNIKKRERKTKNEKKSNNKNIFFTFLYKKIYFLLENIFGKTYFILLHL